MFFDEFEQVLLELQVISIDCWIFIRNSRSFRSLSSSGWHSAAVGLSRATVVRHIQQEIEVVRVGDVAASDWRGNPTAGKPTIVWRRRLHERQMDTLAIHALTRVVGCLSILILHISAIITSVDSALQK